MKLRGHYPKGAQPGQVPPFLRIKRVVLDMSYLLSGNCAYARFRNASLHNRLSLKDHLARRYLFICCTMQRAWLPTKFVTSFALSLSSETIVIGFVRSPRRK